ncbi:MULTISPECIES: cation diffusion facilitator family transporter [Leeia]|uniref:Cation diffusion facilitator family transporter n=1 Tax=Leeia aquatica TaxID=2725557 RepID=A0A847SB80_9NEIS|nr:cation diffusion facilitator family transporter [Leeia aquatica]NLR74786.1 cation diffusion facilitator family transporter [Leeia aquatica]
MSHQADSVKSIIYALTANLAIAVAKLVGAVITRSGSMLAEAIHSFADCANQGLLLWGLKAAKRPPTSDHPLGYGKAIYFWSFIVALMLFSVGGMFSIYEGWHKLHSTEPLSWPWVAIGILTFSIIAEALSLAGCLKEINKARGRRSLWRWARESRQSELIVVLGEDVAALFGLVFALIAIVLTLLTGNPVYDALGSIMIGVLLIAVAVFIGVEIKGLLIGQSIEDREQEDIRQWLKARGEIKQVLNLISLQLGNRCMLAIKAEMAEFTDQHAMIRAINTVEAELRQAFPQVQWLFFEPDDRH